MGIGYRYSIFSRKFVYNEEIFMTSAWIITLLTGIVVFAYAVYLGKKEKKTSNNPIILQNIAPA